MQPENQNQPVPTSENNPINPPQQAEPTLPPEPTVITPGGVTTPTVNTSVEPAWSPPAEASAPASVMPAAEAVPNQPVSPNPIFSAPTPQAPLEPVMVGSQVGGTPISGGSSKKKWLIPVIVIALLLLLGGGYLFAIYLPNTPGNVYKSGLSNTAQGYDALVKYSSDAQSKHYKGYKTDGSLKLTATGLSADGSFSGQSDGNNGTGTLSLDVAGEKFSANARTVQPTGQSTPDLYLQLNGIKPILDGYGLSTIDNLDGQWVVVDHTFIDSLAGASTGTSHAGSLSSPTAAQVQDALTRVGAVNKQYLLSTDPNTQVLQNKKYLGKSTVDGRSVYGYQVGYDAGHLKTYVTALGQALDASKLNDWAKQATGKSLSSTLNISTVANSVSTNKSTYTFDMYIDAKTKLIHQVHFSDATDPINNYVNLGLNYTGGSSYPFSVKFNAKSGSTITTATVTATLDTTTSKISGNFNLNVNDATSPVTLSANFTATPTNDTLTVTAPKNAVSLNTVLGKLGLNSSMFTSPLLNSGTTTGSGSFTLSQ